MKQKILILFCILLLPSVYALNITSDVVFEVDNTSYNINTNDNYSNASINNSFFAVDDTYVKFTIPGQLNATLNYISDNSVVYDFKQTSSQITDLHLDYHFPYEVYTFKNGVQFIGNNTSINTTTDEIMFMNKSLYLLHHPSNGSTGGGGASYGDIFSIYLNNTEVKTNITSNSSYRFNILLVNNGGTETATVKVVQTYPELSMFLLNNNVEYNIVIPKETNVSIPVYLKSFNLVDNKTYAPKVQIIINGHYLDYNIKAFANNSIEQPKSVFEVDNFAVIDDYFSGEYKSTNNDRQVIVVIVIFVLLVIIISILLKKAKNK